MKLAYDLHTVHNTALQKEKKKSIKRTAATSINYTTFRQNGKKTGQRSIYVTADSFQTVTKSSHHFALNCMNC